MKRFSQILKHAALLTAMLLIGSNAWADTLYLLWGTTENITTWSNNTSASGTTEWEWTMGDLSSGGNYYFCISSSTSYTKSVIDSPSKSNISSSITSDAGIQQWNDGKIRNFYWFSLSSAQSGVKLSYNSTTGSTTGIIKIYTSSTTFYTVTPSITGGEISPATAQSVASGSSVTFTVTPTTSYVYTSATYSSTTSGEILKAGNSFTLTPTGTGTLNIVYSAPGTSYTITTSGTNCSFNETSKSIVSGGSFDFVVTPNEGYKITNIAVTNATASPSGSVNYTTSTTVTVSNPTADGTLTITTAPIDPSKRKPTVRIGAKPSVGADCGLTATAYFAQRGCAAIDKVTLYYSNSRAFRIDGKNKTASKEETVSTPAINTSANVTLTSAEISEAVNPGETLYLRFTATNANGTSSYSDILPIKYECNKFITQNLAKSFTACPGQHEFKLSDMFIYPSPTDLRVKDSSNENARSEFITVGDVWIWTPGSKASGTYTYTFTGRTDGYDEATATLTITYTAPSGDAASGLTSLTTSPTTSAESPTKPYTEIALSANGDQGNINEIDWEVTPATAEIYNKSGNTMPATAKFKAQSRASQTSYTVTVSGYTSGCKSVSKTATIVVAPDVKETCN